MQLVVLGMPRSGMSPLTRIINLMGAYGGTAGPLGEATDDNPQGVWARTEVRTVHQEVLTTMGASWHEIAHFDLSKLTKEDQAAFAQKARVLVQHLEAHRPWVLTEASMGLLLPLWRPLLATPICIHLYRHPLEVAQSLRTRHGFPLHFGVALWEKYTLTALANSRDLPRLFVSYHRLREQPRATVGTLYEQLLTLGVHGLRLPSEREILACIDPALSRERGDASLEKEFVSFSQQSLFQALEEGTASFFDGALSLSAGAQAVLESYALEEEQSKAAEAKAWQQQLTEAEQKVIEGQALQQKLAASEQTLAATRERLFALEQKVIEGQALQQKLAASEQTLAATRERLFALEQNKTAEGKAFQQQLTKTKQALAAAGGQSRALEQKLIEVERLLTGRTNEVRQHARDSAQLARWIGLLDRCFVSVINSKRWRLGHTLVAYSRKIRLKPRLPMPQEYWESVMKEFAAWKKAGEDRNKAGQIPPKPASRPLDAVLPAPALQAGKGGGSTSDKDFAGPGKQWSEEDAALKQGNTGGNVNMLVSGKPTATAIGEHRIAAEKQHRIDVVVCVHNALEDVKACLASVMAQTSVPFALYLINDGSDAPTTEWLRQFFAQSPVCHLLESSVAEGYTRAANRGLRASTAEYVVMLNSDTIVPPFWLERLLECASSDPRIGIVGPLSNAASWQSIPECFSPTGDWATNSLPPGMTVESMAQLVQALSPRRFPRVPFVNGFCFVIKRAVIAAIGLFDEERFPKGYGEENDYCLRAADAGFHLAIADNAYVYHAKSKSYGHQMRETLAKQGSTALKETYGQPRITALVQEIRGNPLLAEFRQTISAALAKKLPALSHAPPPLSLLFLLPVHGHSGGSHSVVQEAQGMRKLGVHVQIANARRYQTEFTRNYARLNDTDDLFYFYDTVEELVAQASRFSVVIATIYHSVWLLQKIVTTNPSIMPAYYVQDYEPLFFTINDKRREEARHSYTLVPDTVLFAKTQWLCETIEAEHGVKVERVKPSLDHEIYTPPLSPVLRHGPVRIVAMIRPTTPRRGAARTMLLLKRLKMTQQEQVHIDIFGCESSDAPFQQLQHDFEFQQHGVLTREGVAELLRHAEIFIDLSDYQAFGRTGLEAMACECAVVLPRAGGVYEYAVDRENALLVDTSSHERCYATVIDLVRDDDLRRKLTQNALVTAKEYSIEKSACSEVEMFQRRWRAWQEKCGVFGVPERKPPLNITVPHPSIVSQTASSPTKTASPDVTIVVSIYNAYDEVQACLDSLVRNTSAAHRVLLLDDASPDPRIWPWLQSYTKTHAHMQAVRNPHNLGYTATINKGCALAGRSDVILLNSDTQVTPGWVDKLVSVAYGAQNVATVTPLSNAAGAFSIPENNTVNHLPGHLSIDDMGRLVERLSQHLRPAVPTGNGFCLYIARRALDAVGEFDVQHFPRGYGEENDFCMRASARGFVHLIDDATFIYHKREASFKDSKKELVADGQEALRQLHPTYKQLVTQWLANDPLAEFRRTLTHALEAEGVPSLPAVLPQSRRGPAILYVVHDGSGGTILTNEDLVYEVARTHQCFILKTAIDKWSLFECDNGQLVRIKEVRFSTDWQITAALGEERIRLLRDICSSFQIRLAHVRHLLANAPEVLAAFRNLGVLVLFSFHDFYTICPTVRLIDNHRNYCAGHCTPGDGTCRVPRTWILSIPQLKHHFVHTWRKQMSEALSHCNAYVTTSRSTCKVLIDHFPFLADGKLHLIEHGRDLQDYTFCSVPPSASRVKVVFFGALGIEKGFRLVEALMRWDAQNGARFEFHLLGDKAQTFAPEQFGGIYHGPYDRQTLPTRLAEIAPSFSLIPSLWPETYCHTLTESWAAGIPVIASEIGTLRERVTDLGGGWLAPPSDPMAWYDLLKGVVDKPEEYERRREEIRRMRFKSVKDMAEEYVALYAELLLKDQGFLIKTPIDSANA